MFFPGKVSRREAIATSPDTDGHSRPLERTPPRLLGRNVGQTDECDLSIQTQDPQTLARLYSTAAARPGGGRIRRRTGNSAGCDRAVAKPVGALCRRESRV